MDRPYYEGKKDSPAKVSADAPPRPQDDISSIMLPAREGVYPHPWCRLHTMPGLSSSSLQKPIIQPANSVTQLASAATHLASCVTRQSHLSLRHEISHRAHELSHRAGRLGH